MYLRGIHLLLIVLCLTCAGKAQQSTNIVIPPESTDLPPTFSRFSAADVLNTIWDDYDPKTGRVNHILNESKQPSLVRVDIARRWIVGRKNYLVVMTEIAGYDEQFGDLGVCGNCRAASPLAVLEVVNNKLHLVAKQEDEFYQGDDDSGSPYTYEPFWYNGHESDVKFDLAPYRLNEREMLIGIRKSHMWIPAQVFSTELFLYRIEGTRLREVFNELMIQRDFPDGLGKDPLPIEKSMTTLMMRPTKGNFNDMVATKTTHQCNGDNETYDCTGGKLRKVEKIVWRFDGSIFTEVKD